MKELLPYLIIIFICLISLIAEGILLTKAFKKKEAEMTKNYVDVLTQIRKDLEKEIENYKKEPIKIKQTLVPTNEYAKTIIIDREDINLLDDEKELMEILRSGFADQFAKEVIKPNLNIHEIMDMDLNLHGKKKYMAKMWIGF